MCPPSLTDEKKSKISQIFQMFCCVRGKRFNCILILSGTLKFSSSNTSTCQIGTKQSRFERDHFA